MNLRTVRAVEGLVKVIDMLAPPSPSRKEPDKRARCGIPSSTGPVWDGGKLWNRQDREIARAIARARKAVAS